MKREELVGYLNGLLVPERFRDYCPNGLQVEGRDRIVRLVAGPADQRHAQQFLLEYEDAEGALGHVVLQGHRFPSRLVLGEDHAGFLRHVLEADDTRADAEQVLDAPLDRQPPQAAGAVAPDAPQPSLLELQSVISSIRCLEYDN